jgi:hypothetical protein
VVEFYDGTENGTSLVLFTLVPRPNRVLQKHVSMYVATLEEL